MASAARLCFHLALASAVFFVCFARDMPSGTEDYRHELSGTGDTVDVVQDYSPPGSNPRHNPLTPPPASNGAAGTTFHNG